MSRQKIVFLGNGMLADFALEVLEKEFDIVFVAHKKEDLEEVARLKKEDKSIVAILASFGVMVPSEVLELFEPWGILNIHPSLLPKYRGASPIETAILNGDEEFGVSIMKLAKKMDAGPVYFQENFEFGQKATKAEIYEKLAKAGAEWIVKNYKNLSAGKSQDESLATYTQKFDKSMSKLEPKRKTAQELNNQIRAQIGFPKSRYSFFGVDCIILKAKVVAQKELLAIECYDESVLEIEMLQPAGKKPMATKDFLNGYGKNN